MRSYIEVQNYHLAPGKDTCRMTVIVTCNIEPGGHAGQKNVILWPRKRVVDFSRMVTVYVLRSEK